MIFIRFSRTSIVLKWQPLKCFTQHFSQLIYFSGLKEWKYEEKKKRYKIDHKMLTLIQHCFKSNRNRYCFKHEQSGSSTWNLYWMVALIQCLFVFMLPSTMRTSIFGKRFYHLFGELHKWAEWADFRATQCPNNNNNNNNKSHTQNKCRTTNKLRINLFLMIFYIRSHTVNRQRWMATICLVSEKEWKSF